MKESTSTTIESTLEPAETYRIRPRQQFGTVTIGRRENGTLGFLRGLTNRECFSEFRTSFGCWVINFPITDGECEQNTHSYSMYRCAQCVSTSNCTVCSLFITRTRVAQDCERLCPKTFSHPRVMSHSLPHLTLTTSTSSLSPTSPVTQSSSSAHPSLLSHDSYSPCDDSRRNSGSSDLQSPTPPGPRRLVWRRNRRLTKELDRQDAAAPGDEFGAWTAALSFPPPLPSALLQKCQVQYCDPPTPTPTPPPPLPLLPHTHHHHRHAVTCRASYGRAQDHSGPGLSALFAAGSAARGAARGCANAAGGAPGKWQRLCGPRVVPGQGTAGVPVVDGGHEPHPSAVHKCWALW